MTKTETTRRTENLLLIGIITLVVVGVVGVFAAMQKKDARPPLEHFGPDDSIPRGVTSDGLPFLGNPEALVTMILYEDFGCPNCKNFFSTVEPAIIDNYVEPGKVRLVIYTLAFVNSYSLPGAEAGRCAQDQDGFWAYRDLLFSNQGVVSFSRQNLVGFAEQAGLDREQFVSCFDQAIYEREVIEKSQNAFVLGVNATPTFDINGVRNVGVIPFSSDQPDQPGVKQLIDQALGE